MGWDAWAVLPKGVERDFVRKAGLDVMGDELSDAKLARKWREVAEEVKAVAGSVDGWLSRAGLDCSPCALALEEATGKDAWEHDGWSFERVRELAAKADWSKCTREPWATESAKAFLNTCAELGWGITFS